MPDTTSWPSFVPHAPHVRPLEGVAVAGRAAEVGVEHEVAVGGEILLLEVEAVADRRVRAAVVEHDQRIRSLGAIESVRLREKAFDHRAVVALPRDPLGLRDADLRADVGGHVGQLPLALAVDAGGPHFGRAVVGADRVGDLRHRLVERDRVQPPLALRDLLDRRVRARGDAEQVRGAALLRGEVHIAAIGRPARRVRLEIPRRGEIDVGAAGGGFQDQIVGAAVIQPLLDDHVGAERPLGEQEPAIGRIRQRAPHVAVGGEPAHVAVGGDGVDVGMLVTLLVLPAFVGGERDRRCRWDARPRSRGACRAT